MDKSDLRKMSPHKSYLETLLESLERLMDCKNLQDRDITVLHWKFTRLSEDCDEFEDVDLLVLCCLKYVDLILKYSESFDNVIAKHRNAIGGYFEVLRNMGLKPSLRNKFAESITVPLLERITDPSVKCLCGKEITRNLNTILQNCDIVVRTEIFKSRARIHLYKLADAVCSCGDYEYQTCLLEVIFRMCTHDTVSAYASQFFPETESLQQGLLKIDINEFDKSSRVFLSTVNAIYRNVFSIKVTSVCLDDIRVLAPLDDGGNRVDMWVDFNMLSNTIGIFCDKVSLAKEFRWSQNSQDNGWEVLTFYSSDISLVKLVRSKASDNEQHPRIIIHCFKTAPCSYLHDTSQDGSNADILKLEIPETKVANELITEFLPRMFQEKFEALRNNTSRVKPAVHASKALPLKAVYEPLKVIIGHQERHTRASSDGRSQKSFNNLLLLRGAEDENHSDAIESAPQLICTSDATKNRQIIQTSSNKNVTYGSNIPFVGGTRHRKNISVSVQRIHSELDQIQHYNLSEHENLEDSSVLVEKDSKNGCRYVFDLINTSILQLHVNKAKDIKQHVPIHSLEKISNGACVNEFNNDSDKENKNCQEYRTSNNENCGQSFTSESKEGGLAQYNKEIEVLIKPKERETNILPLVSSENFIIDVTHVTHKEKATRESARTFEKTNLNVECLNVTSNKLDQTNTEKDEKLIVTEKQIQTKEESVVPLNYLSAESAEFAIEHKRPKRKNYKKVQLKVKFPFMKGNKKNSRHQRLDITEKVCDQSATNSLKPAEIKPNQEDAVCTEVLHDLNSNRKEVKENEVTQHAFATSERHQCSDVEEVHDDPTEYEKGNTPFIEEKGEQSGLVEAEEHSNTQKTHELSIENKNVAHVNLKQGEGSKKTYKENASANSVRHDERETENRNTFPEQGKFDKKEHETKKDATLITLETEKLPRGIKSYKKHTILEKKSLKSVSQINAEENSIAKVDVEGHQDVIVAEELHTFTKRPFVEFSSLLSQNASKASEPDCISDFQQMYEGLIQNRGITDVNVKQGKIHQKPHKVNKTSESIIYEEAKHSLMKDANLIISETEKPPEEYTVLEKTSLKVDIEPTSEENFSSNIRIKSPENTTNKNSNLDILQPHTVVSTDSDYAKKSEMPASMLLCDTVRHEEAKETNQISTDSNSIIPSSQDELPIQRKFIKNIAKPLSKIRNKRTSCDRKTSSSIIQKLGDTSQDNLNQKCTDISDKLVHTIDTDKFLCQLESRGGNKIRQELQNAFETQVEKTSKRIKESEPKTKPVDKLDKENEHNVQHEKSLSTGRVLANDLEICTDETKAPAEKQFNKELEDLSQNLHKIVHASNTSSQKVSNENELAQKRTTQELLKDLLENECDKFQNTIGNETVVHPHHVETDEKISNEEKKNKEENVYRNKRFPVVRIERLNLDRVKKARRVLPSVIDTGLNVQSERRKGEIKDAKGNESVCVKRLHNIDQNKTVTVKHRFVDEQEVGTCSKKKESQMPVPEKPVTPKLIYDTNTELVFSQSNRARHYNKNKGDLSVSVDKEDEQERLSQTDTNLFIKPKRRNARRLYNPNDQSYLENLGNYTFDVDLKHDEREVQEIAKSKNYKSSDSKSDTGRQIVTRALIHAAPKTEINDKQSKPRPIPEKDARKKFNDNQNLDLITVCEEVTKATKPAVTKILLNVSDELEINNMDESNIKTKSEDKLSNNKKKIKGKRDTEDPFDTVLLSEENNIDESNIKTKSKGQLKNNKKKIKGKRETEDPFDKVLSSEENNIDESNIKTKSKGKPKNNKEKIKGKRETEDPLDKVLSSEEKTHKRHQKVGIRKGKDSKCIYNADDSNRMDMSKRDLYISFMNDFYAENTLLNAKRKSAISAEPVFKGTKRRQHDKHESVSRKRSRKHKKLENNERDIDAPTVLSKTVKRRRHHERTQESKLMSSEHEVMDILTSLPQSATHERRHKAVHESESILPEFEDQNRVTDRNVVHRSDQTSVKPQIKILQNIILQTGGENKMPSDERFNPDNSVNSLSDLARHTEVFLQQISEVSDRLDITRKHVFKNVRESDIHSWIATGVTDHHSPSTDELKHILESIYYIVKDLLSNIRGPISSEKIMEYELFCKIEEALEEYFSTNE